MHSLLFCGRKLLHSHLSNYRHPFFQTSCKNIVVMPMNVKEFDNFFRRSVDHLPIFVQIPSKTVNSVFPPKMINFAISSIFHPKRFCSVPTQCVLYIELARSKILICHWKFNGSCSFRDVSISSFCGYFQLSAIVAIALSLDLAVIKN